MEASTERTFRDGRVAVMVGDVTRQDVDAIVNAANSSLLGGGGVDGAIHHAGGPAILEACRTIRQKEYPNGLPTGDAVITTGGKLPARYVIHTVGPVYGRNRGRDAELLAACYGNSLDLAVSHRLQTIAFPAISTGIFAYPQDEAARVSSQAIADFLTRNDKLVQVRLLFFQPQAADIFLQHQQFE